MDYEAIDREMSRWLVSCEKNGTRFYLTDEGTASDILSRARRYRDIAAAEVSADGARLERAWSGFDWQAISRASAR